MTPTTIQIYEDVKSRLLEEREDEKESFNDILRRLLDMNEHKNIFEGKTPNRYEAIITKNYFMNNEVCNSDFLNTLNLTDDQNQDILSGIFDADVVINGVDVRISIQATMTLKFEAKTKEDIFEMVDKVKPVVEKIVELNDNHLDVSAWHCCDMKLLDLK